MKKLLLILLCLPMIFSCGDKDEKKPKKFQSIISSELNGNVKIVKINTFSAIEKNSTAQKGELIKEDSLIFNLFGHIIEVHSSNNQIQLVSKYLYDEKKRFIGFVCYDFEGNLDPCDGCDDGRVSTEYEYLENNQVKMTAYNLEGDSVFGKYIEEDSGGWSVGHWYSKDFQYPDIRKSNETYVHKEYDEQESWILRLTYVDGNLIEITEREIEYYNNQ